MAHLVSVLALLCIVTGHSLTGASEEDNRPLAFPTAEGKDIYCQKPMTLTASGQLLARDNSRAFPRASAWRQTSRAVSGSCLARAKAKSRRSRQRNQQRLTGENVT